MSFIVFYTRNKSRKPKIKGLKMVGRKKRRKRQWRYTTTVKRGREKEAEKEGGDK